MREYASLADRDDAFFEHLKKTLGEETLRPYKTSSSLRVRLTHPSGLCSTDYMVSWDSEKTTGITCMTLWNAEDENFEMPPLHRVQDAYSEETRRLCEAVASFEPARWEGYQGGKRTFYGFGVGIDDEFHRRACELADVEGELRGGSTVLRLQKVTEVCLPHPFFAEKGVQTRWQIDAATHEGGETMDEHMEKLRRARDTIRLLERSLL